MCATHFESTRGSIGVGRGFTLLPMSREVLNTLGIHEVVKQHLDIGRGADDELLLGLARLTLNSDAGVADLRDTPRAVGRTFEVMPAVLRSSTGGARKQETKESSPDSVPTSQT